MDLTEDREAILKAAVDGVRRVAEAIAALPQGQQERAFEAAEQTYQQTVRDLGYPEDVAGSWVSHMMYRLRADVEEINKGSADGAS
jgi:Mg/Co/Ni transporter MgtE